MQLCPMSALPHVTIAPCYKHKHLVCAYNFILYIFECQYKLTFNLVMILHQKSDHCWCLNHHPWLTTYWGRNLLTNEVNKCGSHCKSKRRNTLISKKYLDHWILNVHFCTKISLDDNHLSRSPGHSCLETAGACQHWARGKCSNTFPNTKFYILLANYNVSHNVS